MNSVTATCVSGEWAWLLSLITAMTAQCSRSDSQSDLKALCCGFCSSKSMERRVMFKHLKESHANDPGFYINCLLCGRTFKIVSSFSSHISRSHHGTTAENAYDSKMSYEDPAEESSSQLASCDIIPNDFADESNDVEAADVDEPSQYDVSFSAGHFIVGLKEKHLVSSTMGSVLFLTSNEKI